MMMKRLVPYFIILPLCMSVCVGSIADVPQTADGYLAVGEYAVLSITLEDSEELFVTGGGAEIINVEDRGYLEVQSTSPPYENEGDSGTWDGGIMDIFLYDDSELLYLGGITDEITLKYDSTAELRGGTINGITLYRRPQDSTRVTIYCQEGYLKTAAGISGLWADGTSFDIDFINVSSPFPPTANYVFVEIVPEPTTLLMLSLGGLLIRTKK